MTIRDLRLQAVVPKACAVVPPLPFLHCVMLEDGEALKPLLVDDPPLLKVSSRSKASTCVK